MFQIIVFKEILFTILELRVTEVEVLAGSYRIFFGTLRFLDSLKVLSHRVDGTVHV